MGGGPRNSISLSGRFAEMAAKTLVLLFAVLAVAASEVAKRQAIVAPVAYAEDDGSYYPGKYEGTGLPYSYQPYAAYPYARAAYAYPYAAAPVVASAYHAAPVVASAYAAAPVVAAPAAPIVHPYATAYGSYLANDDGSYFPGKYGPEYQV